MTSKSRPVFVKTVLSFISLVRQCVLKVWESLREIQCGDAMHFQPIFFMKNFLTNVKKRGGILSVSCSCFVLSQTCLFVLLKKLRPLISNLFFRTVLDIPRTCLPAKHSAGAVTCHGKWQRTSRTSLPPPLFRPLHLKIQTVGKKVARLNLSVPLPDNAAAF